MIFSMFTKIVLKNGFKKYEPNMPIIVSTTVSTLLIVALFT